MSNSKLHHSVIFTFIIFFALFIELFYNSSSYAQESNSLAGTQLAYFVGYHSGGMHKDPVYYRPSYHFKGSYRTPWTTIGHTCRKTCLLDRWTGRSLYCYKTC